MLDRLRLAAFVASGVVLVVGCEAERSPGGETPGAQGEGEGEGEGGGEGEGEGEGEGVAAEGEGEGQGPPPVGRCGLSDGTLPEHVVVLEWHDGNGRADITRTNASVLGNPLTSVPLHEAVRFEVDHPACVYGFSVQYGVLPPEPETPVRAGLYHDFGNNGFDFWAPDPLRQVSHDSGDLALFEWVDFVFAEPFEVVQPSLLYVAHRREAGPWEPSWRYDASLPEDCNSPNGCCQRWDQCHSSWNLPELTRFENNGQGFYNWNGLTTQFAYDYMVRLHVKYLDQQAPEDKAFQPVEGPTPSSRMSWGDFDNDGDDDLLNSGPRLLRNDDGVLIDITEESNVNAHGRGAGGGVWGDYDNDGCLDLFLWVESGGTGDTLLKGDCDGGFTDTTEAAGISDIQDYNPCGDAGWTHAPTPAAAWWDMDGDGLLDLYLANFICWSNYSYFTDVVWHNEGDGTFSDWTGTRGLRGDQDPRWPGRGANPVDRDQDGDVDMLVNHYVLVRNVFYDNQGDGTVIENALDLGLAGHSDSFGQQRHYGHTIGTAWGDLDGDGDFDVVEANLAHPRFWDFSDKTQVLLQGDDGRFTDSQGDWSFPRGDAGLRYQETHSVPVLGDFDADGALDLAISATYDGRPTDFYLGNGDGTFRDDRYAAGITVESGWCMATADFDLDGDLDLATSGVLYENRREPAGHWLQVRAIGGARSNRAAIGATIRARLGDRTVVRYVPGGNGQGCQDSQTQHFGLGTATTVSSIEVDFPGAGTVTYAGPFDADQRLYLHEDGAATPGWSPPQ